MSDLEGVRAGLALATRQERVNAGSKRVFGAGKDLKGSHKFSGISIDHSAPATSLADDLVLLPWWFSLVIPPTFVDQANDWR